MDKHQVVDRLIQGHTLVDDAVFLGFDQLVLEVKSNSNQVLNLLKQYFPNERTLPNPSAQRMILIESPPDTFDFSFSHWPREAGKQGIKESVLDLNEARLIRKQRSGMLFFQTEMQKIAVGPCLNHINQIVNFINNQHMNWLQQQDWLICHAAAIAYKQQAYVFAGFSGGGKSSIMLRMMNHPEVDFLSNDRLFLKRLDDKIFAQGIAKLPRVNPGTLMANQRLRPLLSEQKIASLSKLSKQQLWDLEEKYDVDIEAIYQRKRIPTNLPLKAIFILNWNHDNGSPVKVEPVQLAQRLDLLPAIMKSSGPFYQDKQGNFLPQNSQLDSQRYLSILSDVITYEVSGTIAFSELETHIISRF